MLFLGFALLMTVGIVGTAMVRRRSRRYGRRPSETATSYRGTAFPALPCVPAELPDLVESRRIHASAIKLVPASSGIRFDVPPEPATSAASRLVSDRMNAVGNGGVDVHSGRPVAEAVLDQTPRTIGWLASACRRPAVVGVARWIVLRGW